MKSEPMKENTNDSHWPKNKTISPTIEKQNLSRIISLVRVNALSTNPTYNSRDSEILIGTIQLSSLFSIKNTLSNLQLIWRLYPKIQTFTTMSYFHEFGGRSSNAKIQVRKLHQMF